MSDLFNNNDTNTKELSTELAEVVEVAKKKALIYSQIVEFNDMCWDKCVDRPSAKLDGRTQTCMKNCVNRFLDVSIIVTDRISRVMMDNSSKQYGKSVQELRLTCHYIKCRRGKPSGLRDLKIIKEINILVCVLHNLSGLYNLQGSFGANYEYRHT